MKVFSRSLFVVAISTFVLGSAKAIQPTSPPEPAPTVALPCANRATTQSACESGDGLCTLTNGNTKTCVDRACSDRSNENQCESGGICIWDGKANGATCKDLQSGNKTLGQTCSVQLIQENSGDFWVDVNGEGCAPGLTCTLDNSYPEVVPGSIVSGVCDSEQCSGKKNPTNCNGGSNANQAGCSQATERVTICHRTCSAKNPWVRITIDNDAWNGTGCGHLLQHDVRDECKNKAPWAEWGANRKDYLIKWHGTRAQVSARLNNTALEKKYWRMWEPACPYVRNGACCNWGITNPNDPDYNPCCGINPGEVVLPVPAIQVKKYAGPPGMCSNGTMSSSFVDDVYTLPIPINASQWQYCYKVTVPPDSECIYNVRMTDSAPKGGIGSLDVTTVTTGQVSDTDGDATICPGEQVLISGQVVTGLNAPELSYDAVVTGTSVQTRKPVASKDPAGVTPDFRPSVTINKFVGPPGGCPTSAASPPLEPVTFMTGDDHQFMYCYYITNTGNECLLNAKMTDLSPVGGSEVTFPEKFCPGDVKVFGGPNSTTAKGEPCINATIMGTGEYSNQQVTEWDDACVIVPTPVPAYTPNVIIRKFAGPYDSCNETSLMLPVAPMEDVLYITDDTKEFMYCYYIKNNGTECLLNSQMTDGGTVFNLGPDQFCPGDVVVLEGKKSKFTNPHSTEECSSATVVGTGANSGFQATDMDGACVRIPPQPPTYHPAVTILKYAGPPGSCPVDMTSEPEPPMEPELYNTTLELTFQYCYYIKNTGDECLVNVMVNDPADNGGGTYKVTDKVDDEFCPGDAVVIASQNLTGSFHHDEKCMNATVMGHGVSSHDLVKDDDDACVAIPDEPEPPIVPPTEPPKCVSDMIHQSGSEHCPNQEGVVLAKVLGADKQLPGGGNPIDMIYNIESVDDGRAVSFKVESPYPDLSMYIQYQKPAAQGGWDQVCDGHDTSECPFTEEALVAGCLQGDGKNPFTLFQVYFVDDSPSPPFLGGAALEECCIGRGNSLSASSVVAQFSFLMRCECPAISRRLGKSEKIDVEKVLSAFSALD